MTRCEATSLQSKMMGLFCLFDPYVPKTTDRLSRFEKLTDAETGDIAAPPEAERSITPMRPSADRRATFSPRSAVSSLRCPFPRHSTRQKRASVHSVYYGDRQPATGAIGPERFSTDSQEEGADVAHGRRTSVASSIVGSIRSIGRSARPKKVGAPSNVVGSEKRSPTKIAATVPLPSSPIPIPAPAPALALDLGPAGFMPPAFVDYPDADQKQDLRRLTDSDNTHSDRPSTGGLHIPAELVAKHESPIPRFLSPRSFLSIPLPDAGPAFCSGPPTPMPGTNLSLELDGTGAIDLPVFERSVENDGDSSQRSGVRHMRSLDALAKEAANRGDAGCAADSTEALAEAAAVAPRADEHAMHRPSVSLATPLSCQGDNTFNALLSRAPLVINEGSRPGCCRDLASASTISTCPSDMQSLCQQSGPLPANMDDCRDEPWPPEAQSNLGPPLPTRSVIIPLRPKPEIDQGKNEDQAAESNFDTPRPLPAVPHSSKLCISEWPRHIADVLCAGRVASLQTPQPTCRLVMPSPSPGPSPNAASKQTEPPPAHGSPPGDDSPNLRVISKGFLSFNFAKQETRQPFVAADSDSDLNDTNHPAVAKDVESVITDYDEYKTQQLFLDHIENDDIKLPDYDHAECDDIESSRISGAVNAAPLVMSPLYQAATSSQATSPISNQAGLRGTDVGNLFWRFNVDSWLGHGQQRGSEASIDGFSEAAGGAISSEAVVTADPEPRPSKDDLLLFGLDRSQRSMRCNALHSDSLRQASGSRPASSNFAFGRPESDMDELQLAAFDAAFADAESALDRNNSTATQGRRTEALDLAIQETNRAALILNMNVLTDSSEPETPLSAPAAEIYLPERSSLDYLRSPVDSELLDAVQTSSPIQLTEWERSELQIAVPSPAHEESQELDDDPAIEPTKPRCSPSHRGFSVPIKPPTLPARTYSPDRRVSGASDAPDDIAAADAIGIRPDYPTSGLQSGGFCSTSTSRATSQNRFAALVEAPRKALRVLGASGVNARGTVMVQTEVKKEGIDEEDRENAGDAAKGKSGGGFRPMRLSGPRQ